jgi:UDP-N-acetyl-D-glucosamine dehydrogenase
VNENMPWWCLGKITRALNAHEKALKGSKVQILGVSYKADIDDVRESPAEKIILLLNKAGAEVAYHDPHVAEFEGMRSVDYAPEDYDCVVIVTAHSAIDYGELVERAEIVVDFRNATGRNGTDSAKVWKL